MSSNPLDSFGHSVTRWTGDNQIADIVSRLDKLESSIIDAHQLVANEIRRRLTGFGTRMNGLHTWTADALDEQIQSIEARNAIRERDIQDAIVNRYAGIQGRLANDGIASPQPTLQPEDIEASSLSYPVSSQAVSEVSPTSEGLTIELPTPPKTPSTPPDDIFIGQPVRRGPTPLQPVTPITPPEDTVRILPWEPIDEPIAEPIPVQPPLVPQPLPVEPPIQEQPITTPVQPKPSNGELVPGKCPVCCATHHASPCEQGRDVPYMFTECMEANLQQLFKDGGIDVSELTNASSYVAAIMPGIKAALFQESEGE